MKTRWSSEQLDTLLDRGGLGATRREAILEEVLAKARAVESPPRRWRWSLAGLGVAAVAAALVLIVPRLSQPDGPAYRAKGARPSTDLSTTSLECLGATPQACPSGALLLVRASGVRGYLSAWAQPANGGERIWYFSAETSSPLVGGDSPSPEDSQRAVRIGAEHAVGSYVVEIRVTKQPMNREQLLSAQGPEVLAKGRAPLTVVPPR